MEEENVADKYKVGDVLWVNLEGFPWWPATVIDPTPSELDNLKIPSVPTDRLVVRFFNDNDRYSLTSDPNIRPFRRDAFYNRRLEFRGKLYSTWKKAVDDAWDFVHTYNKPVYPDTPDHHSDHPDPDDPPAADPDESLNPPMRKRSITDVDSRPKKRKRTTVPPSPADSHNSDFHLSIAADKEKGKKRSKKSDVSRSKSKDSTRSTDKEHKPQRRRPSAILKRSSSDVNVPKNVPIPSNSDDEASKIRSEKPKLPLPQPKEQPVPLDGPNADAVDDADMDDDIKPVAQSTVQNASPVPNSVPNSVPKPSNDMDDDNSLRDHDDIPEDVPEAPRQDASDVEAPQKSAPRSPDDVSREVEPIRDVEMNREVDPDGGDFQDAEDDDDGAEIEQSNPYERISKEECVELLIVKDRALRDANMKLWKLQCKHSRKNKLTTQEGLDKACGNALMVAEKFLRAAEKDKDGIGTAPNLLKLEEKSVEAIQGLRKVYFDVSKIDVTPTGDEALRFVERIASLSTNIAIELRDVVILWMDIMSSQEAKGHKRHSKSSKKSHAEKKSSREKRRDEDTHEALPEISTTREHRDVDHVEDRNDWDSRNIGVDEDDVAQSPLLSARARSPVDKDSGSRRGETRRDNVQYSEDDFSDREQSGGQNADAGHHGKKHRDRALHSEQKEVLHEDGSGDIVTADGYSNRLDHVGEADRESLERGKSDNSLDAVPNSRFKSSKKAYKHESPSISPPRVKEEEQEEYEDAANGANGAEGEAVEEETGQAIAEDDDLDSHKHNPDSPKAEPVLGEDHSSLDKQPRTSRSSLPSVKREDLVSEKGPSGRRDKKGGPAHSRDSCIQAFEKSLSMISKDMIGSRIRKQTRGMIAQEMEKSLLPVFEDDPDGHYQAGILVQRSIQMVMRTLSGTLETEQDDSPMTTAFRTCMIDPSKAGAFVDICRTDFVEKDTNTSN